MANRDVVAIGTSAGGVDALLSLVKGLPRTFPASVLVTIHLPSHARSAFDELLTRAGSLHAQFAGDGDVIQKSRIYLAPPNRHLLLDDHRVSLGLGPRENNSRPAIDAMLRSIAVCCGSRAIGVVLTGTLGDGASGLWAVRKCGGVAVVQDPQDAAFAEMPLTALSRAKPDHVVKLADMPFLLEKLVREPPGQPAPVPRTLRYEVEVARSGHTNMNSMDNLGRRSVLACPDCGGVMWEIGENEVVRYRCHDGRTDESGARRESSARSGKRAASSGGTRRSGAQAVRPGRGQRSQAACPGLVRQDARIRARTESCPRRHAAYGADRRRFRAGRAKSRRMMAFYRRSGTFGRRRI
jgi:two-component system chemotaxis response regulator CheB